MAACSMSWGMDDSGRKAGGTNVRIRVATKNSQATARARTMIASPSIRSQIDSNSMRRKGRPC